MNGGHARSCSTSLATPIVEPPRNALTRHLERILSNSAWLRRFVPRENPYDDRRYASARWHSDSTSQYAQDHDDEEGDTSDSEAEFYDVDESHTDESYSGSSSSTSSLAMQSAVKTSSPENVESSTEGSDLTSGNGNKRRKCETKTRAHDDRDKVPVEKIQNLSEYDCSICLRPMSRTSVSVVVPCFHKFDVTCIRKWLRGNRKQYRNDPHGSRPPHCPLCKSLVTHLIYNIRTQSSYRVRRYVRSANIGDRITQTGHVIDGLTQGGSKTGNKDSTDNGNRESSARTGRRKNGGVVSCSPCARFPQAYVSIRKIRKRSKTNPGETTLVTEIQCSVDETNRIRYQLGMKPLV